MERSKDKAENTTPLKALATNTSPWYTNQPNRELTFAIVTHVYATGPSFNLETYLIPKVKKLIFIGHPFSFSHDTSSFLRIYKNGKLVSKKKFLKWKGPFIFFYIKDIILSFFWLLPQGKINYFIGVDNLNAFTGYILRPFLRINKIIFYTIDYIPDRFPNKLLNFIYHFLDTLMIKKSNTIWNLSDIMVFEREKKGIDFSFRKKQIVVPVGTDIESFQAPSTIIRPRQIVFMGHLRKGHGIELLISSMFDVIKEISDASLLIIGSGPLEDKLKEQAKKLGLEKNIQFSGFIEKISDVHRLLRESAIAVAPYENNAFTRFTDPGKVKDYLACGLPIIITKVPQVAYEIDKKKCGIAISYDKKELSDAIKKMLKDKILLQNYRRNAEKMAKEYKWEKIFDKAISQSL